uniref:Gypsy retrotransposon integrase-like protein 1 n=1 Tax=Fundulus heteroclitus TaxID=8078 RepID=A0A3Q2QUM5_FUNHE
MDGIRAETAADEHLQVLIRYIKNEWPEHIQHTQSSAREYFPVRNELSVHDVLVLRGSRIVIPGSMRTEMLERIHDGHQGLNKCRMRANTSVWWPGLASQITHKVENCMYCREHRRAQNREPLLSTPLPDRPWKRIGIDLCEHGKENFLVISDYYSRYLEILHMPTTTSAQVSLKLKATFARYGIPEEVVSDNGPQFSSEVFKDFAHEMDFKHVTSSPQNPQGNGHAERAVQTAKRILQQKDPLLALMIYRSSPHSSTGVSPAELLLGRKIRTTLPTLDKVLQPKWPNRQHIRAKDAVEKWKQAFHYNKRHGVRPLTPLQPGNPVLARLDNQKTWSTPAEVVGESTTERSYVIATEQGALYRRDRRHLQALPEVGSSVEQSVEPNTPDVQASSGGSFPDPKKTPSGLSQTRSGRVVKPVQRLDL